MVDPRIAAGYSDDPIKRKLQIDELKRHIEGGQSKEKQLRQACEDFESVFIQKIWEQMRKSVPKEGYLHSRDEEMYQSMFDVEFSKKMASAGGIGLADMLYEQLNIKLGNASRATSPSMLRNSRALQSLDSQDKGIEIEPRYGSLKRDPGTEYALSSSERRNPDSIYSEYREDGIEYINPYAQAGLANAAVPEQAAAAQSAPEGSAQMAGTPEAGVGAWQRNFYGLNAYTGNLQHDVNAVGSISAARQRAAENPSEDAAPKGIGAAPAMPQANFSESVKFVDPLAPDGLAEAPFTASDLAGRQRAYLAGSQNIPGFTGMKPPFPIQPGMELGVMGNMGAMGSGQAAGIMQPGAEYSLDNVILENMGALGNEPRAENQNIPLPTPGNVIVPPSAGMPAAVLPDVNAPVNVSAPSPQQDGRNRQLGAADAEPAANSGLTGSGNSSQSSAVNSVPDGMFLRFDNIPEI